MKIVYTPSALRQLDEVLTYIGERNPQGAFRLHARIRAFVNILAQHPLIGQTMSRTGQRRLILSPYPYAMFYRMRVDAVVIQRIRHTARRPI